MTILSLIFSMGLLTTAFFQIGSTPIWVPLIIILVIILLFWWGLTRNRIPDNSSEQDEKHDEDLPSRIETENLVQEENSFEETEEITNASENVEPGPALVPDDLKLIEGIGPKISSILADAGIVTFTQLAACDVQTLEKLVRDDAGIKLASPATWPEQARLASEGKWDELEQLQDQLHGGRQK